MPYDNMYFETLKSVLDQAIPNYCRRRGSTCGEADRLIVQYIQNTSEQHSVLEPDINYGEPLCRLGYLYVHAGVNATLLEQTVSRSSMLSQFICGRAGGNVSVCAVGGGPGTELLGLTKYLLLRGCSPSDIRFTVLDSVPYWSETWVQLSDASQLLLRNRFNCNTVIHREFQPMDVVSADSYRSYGWLFERVNIFIYNYLLSENQIRLSDFSGAFSEMIADAASGSFFVIIDRLERNTHFRTQVREMVANSGLQVCDDIEHAGVVTDQECAFGEYLQRFAPRRPRRWFRTQQMRYPTAFAIVARKP